MSVLITNHTKCWDIFSYFLELPPATTTNPENLYFYRNGSSFTLMRHNSLGVYNVSLSGSNLHVNYINCNGSEADILFCYSQRWYSSTACYNYVPWIDNCRKYECPFLQTFFPQQLLHKTVHLKMLKSCILKNINQQTIQFI